MPEEEAFAVFVKIMQDYGLRELYKPSMAEIGLCIYQLECMIQVNLFLKSRSFDVFAFECFLILFRLWT